MGLLVQSEPPSEPTTYPPTSCKGCGAQVMNYQCDHCERYREDIPLLTKSTQSRPGAIP